MLLKFLAHWFQIFCDLNMLHNKWIMKNKKSKQVYIRKFSFYSCIMISKTVKGSLKKVESDKKL